MSLKEQARQIKELKEHPGWALMKAQMEREIKAATTMLVEVTRPLEDVYRRHGAIWAAQQLLQLPERLLMELENAAALEEANKLAATAAKQEN